MTLRSALLAASLLMATGGAVGVALGAHTWPVTIWGVVIFVSLLIENRHYCRTVSAPGSAPGIRTGERFVDPDSGVTMEVIYDPATGERRYVPEVAADNRR